MSTTSGRISTISSASRPTILENGGLRLMAAELKVPKLGMDMEEAHILRWIVEDGDEVGKGDPVIEIDTDKVSYEVEANADGVIRGLRGEEGETVPVGATLAFITAPGEEWTEPDPAAGDETAT